MPWIFHALNAALFFALPNANYLEVGKAVCFQTFLSIGKKSEFVRNTLFVSILKP